MSAPEAVLLNGLFGVGKSTVLVEMADLLEAADARYAALDLDWLAWASPGDDSPDPADDHPTASPLLLEHLDLITRNLLRHGTTRFAMAGSVASDDELALIEETMGMPLRVVLLQASLDVVRERLAREPTTGRAHDLARTETWASHEHGPASVRADMVIDAERPVTVIASEILRRVGWLTVASDQWSSR